EDEVQLRHSADNFVPMLEPSEAGTAEMSRENERFLQKCNGSAVDQPWCKEKFKNTKWWIVSWQPPSAAIT
uniref:hypothetical protein n=1 Tax=Xanthomarina gelatinilytica TaxID=1137281 RepID=UPI00351427F3